MAAEQRPNSGDIPRVTRRAAISWILTVALALIAGATSGIWLFLRIGPRVSKRKSPASRSGFTLMELLVAIIIIAILAGLFLGAMSSATRAANKANTEALIAKLHTELMLRFESYRTRRLPTSSAVRILNLPSGASPPFVALAPRCAGATRLHAIRELMRMEMPDRYSDLITSPGPGMNPHGLPGSLVVTPIAYAFDMNNSQWIAQGFMQASSGATSYQRQCALNTQKPSATFEDAECLYMLLMGGLMDNDAIATQIGQQNIGDADGDGMREFHDAWGNPIHFLRWAPGYVSDLQPSPPDPQNHRDPFDPLRIQGNDFNLVPLIWSNGPDGISDIQMPATDSNGYAVSSATWTFAFTYVFTTIAGIPNFTATIYDPFSQVGNGDTIVGAPGDTDGDGDTNGWADNITNHLIGQ